MTEEKMEEKPIEEDLEEVSAAPSETDDDAEVESEAEDAVAALKTALASAEEAGKAHEDRFLRLYAEFENYKKRTAREMQDFRKFANEALIRDLLPVIDNLERAIQSSSSQESPPEDIQSCIVEGVSMTLNEILKVLDRYHVKPIDALEKPFDPNFHEAVGQELSDEHADNTVVREYQKGYLLHDRLIRPAMVVVSKAPSTPAGAEPPVSADDAPDDLNNEA